MATATLEQIPTIVLRLTEAEAGYLEALLQNPLSDEEPQLERVMRMGLFATLQEVIP